MSKPLIIYFNDEKMVRSATDHSKFLKKMKFLAKGNSLPVSSVEDFETLMNILPNDLDVFVFIQQKNLRCCGDIKIMSEVIV